MARAPSPGSDSVVVIGLGRFGGAVAESLVRMGHDVLGIDEDAELVQSWADRLTHVVQADTTDGDTLRRLGVHEFERAVVGIGGDIEASVLTVLALSELGVEGHLGEGARARSTGASWSAPAPTTSSTPRPRWAGASPTS